MSSIWECTHCVLLTSPPSPLCTTCLFWGEGGRQGLIVQPWLAWNYRKQSCHKFTAIPLPLELATTPSLLSYVVMKFSLVTYIPLWHIYISNFRHLCLHFSITTHKYENQLSCDGQNEEGIICADCIGF